MSIQPQRSKFKKCTATYFKDNLLDIIDISETLSKNRYIHKCPLKDFIYSKYILNHQLSKENKNNKNNKKDNDKDKDKDNDKDNKNNIINIDDDIHNKNQKIDIKELNYEKIDFEKLNKNNFKIDFTKLKLQYENDYTVLFIEKYYPLELIGEGSFGLVLSVIDIESQNKLAVKIIDKKNLNSQSDIEIISYQVKLLKKLDNPRIMKIFNVLETKKYIFIFMELIEGGNLKDLIINRYADPNSPYLFRDSECSLIMKGILESLKYLHKNNIIHRDIKPENILFKKKNDLSSVVLCDFGLAYQFNEYDKYITDVCGTTIYMAPEIFAHRGYDFLVDSFSAGIILYELCSGGMHPFFVNGMNKNEYIEKMLNFNNKYSFSKEMPLLARNLFLKLCKYDPIVRYEPYKALRHPWITRSNTSQIPMTLLEEYNKSDKILNFKALLATGIALIMIKNKYNMKPKIQESDSTFNESIYNVSSTRKKSGKKINKLVNYKSGNNFPKTEEKISYNKPKEIRKSRRISIPLLTSSRIPNNSNKFKEIKISKKRLFPKIESKSLKKYKSKEFIKDNKNSKLYLNIKKDMEKINDKRLSLLLSKDFKDDSNKRNNSNSHIFLRTYSCKKNKNDSNNNSKNSSLFQNLKNNDKILNKNINNKIKFSNKIFQFNDINLNNEKSRDDHNFFLKNNKTHLILKNNENKNMKAPNLLSLKHEQNKMNINNFNNLPKMKNIHLINRENSLKKNNKKFFLKDVLTNK